MKTIKWLQLDHSHEVTVVRARQAVGFSIVQMIFGAIVVLYKKHDFMMQLKLKISIKFK